MTPVALCADDYGLSPGVDDGILTLARSQRISAFSCMTAAPRWRQSASHLKPLFGSVDIGIHFTLTQLEPLGAMPKLAPDGKFPAMNRLYAQVMLRALDLEEISQELGRQLKVFVEATGREPDFLDGHHHVHQLPGVRDVIARLWTRPGWIRNTATPLSRIIARGVAIPRAAVIARFGAAARQTWLAAGISTNADFSGVRNFDESGSYALLMRQYLREAHPGLLIMCHPGSGTQVAGFDDIAKARAQEFDYLVGDEFPADLKDAGCELVRLSEWIGRQSSSGSD